MILCFFDAKHLSCLYTNIGFLLHFLKKLLCRFNLFYVFNNSSMRIYTIARQLYSGWWNIGPVNLVYYMYLHYVDDSECYSNRMCKVCWNGVFISFFNFAHTLIVLRHIIQYCQIYYHSLIAKKPQESEVNLR